MKTIIENKENTLIIKKSKFIGVIKKVYSLDDINNTLNYYRDLYKDSTHICYAYILNNNKKYSDDNEPSGTAGKAIFNLLEINNIDNILAITIRYFGGIKLGANGLVHAYKDSINNLLNNNLKDKEIGYKIRINTDYNHSKELDSILKDENIISKKYDNNIEIVSIIKKETLDKLSNISYEIIEERII